ncbi:dihydrofolate reductase [Rhodohalobacter sp. SW132]|uniref:dihydrofolate reductase family protein n=1 Tax=Rhodohalobacter sp. SW132 TaxID=2293433 RepID=UPI000E22AB64|nr:dihydrofolate reductase family protein [Rhodohalobacter sp. SW132]REL24022.1 dihydrofolate reductase [Rhodohalobacter sp. SW132]
MRTLKLQVQITADGFVAGPDGQQDWMTWDWDDELQQFADKITSPVDCIVMGRKLAEGFIPYWAQVAEDPDNPEQESGKKFNETPKVVFSHSLEKSKWENTDLVKGDLVDEITQLKQEDGREIIAYGGATFVSNLVKHELVDEFYLFVNPVAIGSGMPIFGKLTDYQSLNLVQTRAFDCGIVLLHYEPK